MSVASRLNLGLGTRLPLVLQSEAAECGIACLAMISHYHGRAVSLPEVRRKYGVSLKGATLKDVIGIGDQIGFASRPLRLELEELEKLKLPCILHWDLNHFVVLSKLSANSITINDPAAGTRRLTMTEASRHFTGVALELTPTGLFTAAEPAPRVKASQLLGQIRGLNKALLQLLGLAGAIEVFAMLSPFFISWVIDHAIVSADRDLLTTLVIGFGLLLVIRTLVNAARSWMLMGLSASLRVQSSANLFTHLLNLPASYFESRYMGDVMSRFGSHRTILNAITNELIVAILDGLMAVITLAIMFYLAPGLATIVFGGAVLYALLRWATYMPLRRASGEAIVWHARGESHFLETMRGIRAVKLMNGQELRRTQWLNLLVEYINRNLTTQKLRILFQTVNGFLMGSLTLLVVYLGANRVLDGGFSVGLMIAFLAYKDQFISRISDLINRAVDLTMLRLHAERLADIALTAPEPRGFVSSEATATAPMSVKIRNLKFRYSEYEPLVLDDINLDIAAGESIAICGPSGGGKSTLFKLLCGLLKPGSGDILIDGQAIDRLGIENFRKSIGVVMQDDQLFAGSIAENICFFADKRDQAKIEEAAKLGGIHDDIMQMPMGYDTLIGDMGTVLSGGQKQRVLLARALYRNPQILLLDEASSHLDAERERTINEALKRLPMTRIVIAHRHETISAADRVLMLQDGKIEEWAGKPQNLLETRQKNLRLVVKQPRPAGDDQVTSPVESMT
jgi:ATP-binding cassette, subfamily B, bacterial CvaB/MchF/RaxB